MVIEEEVVERRMVTLGGDGEGGDEEDEGDDEQASTCHRCVAKAGITCPSMARLLLLSELALRTFNNDRGEETHASVAVPLARQRRRPHPAPAPSLDIPRRAHPSRPS